MPKWAVRVSLSVLLASGQAAAEGPQHPGRAPLVGSLRVIHDEENIIVDLRIPSTLFDDSASMKILNDASRPFAFNQEAHCLSVAVEPKSKTAVLKYRFLCSGPVTFLDAKLFADLPALEELTVQTFSNGKKSSKKLTRSEHILQDF